MSVRALVILVAVGLLMAGCGGAPQDRPVKQIKVQQPAHREKDAKPSVTATPEFVHLLGETARFSSSTGHVFRVVVEDYVEDLEVPNWEKPLTKGYVYDAALIKACLDEGTPLMAYTASWYVMDSDGGRYASGALTEGLPGNEYLETKVAPGSCIKGWISFEVAPEAHITDVLYQPSVANIYAEWTVE